jgi:signal transduction histidine kinase
VTIAFAGLALLLSATLAVFAYELTRAFLIDRREQSARQEAFLNARAVRDSLRVNTLDVSGALRQAQTGSEGAVVLRVGDQWFGTSVGVGRDDVPQSLRRLVASGEAGTQNTELGSSPNIGVGVPLPAVDGAFFEFTPAKELDQTLSLLARALFAAALVATVLGAVVGRYASGRVLRPVRRMALTAGGIADGALDERLDAEGDRDLEPLVEAFNSMVLSLRTRIEREARFASNVSHELRTPIATMTAALNVARRRGSGESAEEALDLLEQELDKFRQLVLDLLEVSRMEGGVAETELERVDPAALVREVLRSTERTTVAVDVDRDAPASCVLDRRRIAQVLTNLLDNADAYGGGATRVVVSGTTETVLIAVDDAGPGVAPEERLHVFERFARGGASESKPGTGLGLALVVEHVRLHDGQVWVDDSPDGGARFVFQLPRSRP